ncbi:chromosome partitioning protein [Actinopolymorpha sp. B17G11]|uniref:AAA family ATPase n=1 Tax=Actinopolymorpha sp. B17G11 TaxID=3160861 RepID=UPI0032E47F7C
MSLPVLTAVTGARWESDLVSALERSSLGLDVVRRCVDLPDLLATAQSGQARAVLLSADLRRLDREAVARLIAGGVAVVGVVSPGDTEGEERLHRIGIAKVVPADAPADVLAGAVAESVEIAHAHGRAPEPDFAVSNPWGAMPSLPPMQDIGVTPETGTGTGQLLAVWGPAGAPGRTTVALTLATELSTFGVPTLLADADVYGGVVAQALGLLDEAPGLAAACRSANSGSLDLAGLARHAREVLPRLRVLTGIQRADRWPELRASALEQVWDLARQLAAATVVDCGFCLEQDEEISFDTAAPRRNGATLTTIERATTVIAVGAADPIGLQRLIRGLEELREAVPGVAVRVVVNSVRKGPVGGDAEGQIRDALRRYAGVDAVVCVPYDRFSFDTAIAQGRSLAEVAPKSPARLPLRNFAADLMGITLPRQRRRKKA